MAKNSTKR